VGLDGNMKVVCVLHSWSSAALSNQQRRGVTADLSWRRFFDLSHFLWALSSGITRTLSGHPPSTCAFASQSKVNKWFRDICSAVARGDAKDEYAYDTQQALPNVIRISASEAGRGLDSKSVGSEVAELILSLFARRWDAGSPIPSWYNPKSLFVWSSAPCCARSLKSWVVCSWLMSPWVGELERTFTNGLRMDCLRRY